MLKESATASSEKGVLVIDEHGDRKWVKHTAHVGRQWLANIGKTESGVVSVSSLLADEEVYYPLEVETHTPAHHFKVARTTRSSAPTEDSMPAGGAFDCNGRKL